MIYQFAILLFFALTAPVLYGQEPMPQYIETLHQEWTQSFSISEEIIREVTAQQELVIFQNTQFGRVLAIDGVIQTTEADEAIYHEMIVHVPLLAHDNPKSILIIGGGDGGTLREVIKHSTLERILLVEIDASVIEQSKKYLPKLSNGAFDDPRLQLVVDDGYHFAKTCKETFDLIICDSTDPIGPGKILFSCEFYEQCKRLLKKNGIFVNQSGVPFMQPEECKMTLANRKPYFKHNTFYIASIPTYIGGPMAFGWSSDKKYRTSESVLQERMEKLKSDFFYYTPAVHKAAFALPNYLRKTVDF